jgi:hypothetical protein
MANGGDSLTLGWYPNTGFIAHRWIGYNEATILYLLGMGAATNPLPAAHWASWTSGYEVADQLRPQLRPVPTVVRTSILALLGRFSALVGRLHERQRHHLL